MRTSARWVAGAVVVAGAVFGVTACEPSSIEDLLAEWLETLNTESASAPDVPEAHGILALVGLIEVGAESTMSDYSRSDFPHWDRLEPEFGFGAAFGKYEGRCTSRDAVLLRDARGTVTLDPATCEFGIGPDGGWLDQYGVVDRQTGQVRDYKWMTESSAVDAEHIVALGEAWRSGASEMDVHTRRLIANDALNVVISDPSANRSKGDQDPSTYLPPGNFRCEYVERYTHVKVKYGLTADADEVAALKHAAEECVLKGELD
ncbi:HNH endonuclease family protein [Hoyosella sp. YIM 151337]|uniref:HNH endonuclease family protein n=1 Tax=Hoyosella sp. YIM 151337 TaxID=2992742 RepID=UPI002236BD3B|nr:HNH endonuclease family protein [Hoyosella sp. YIM 151337]MCW4354858.1 HNH endonuclease family protein [Hoyosella sp. YIM 151337]